MPPAATPQRNSDAPARSASSSAEHATVKILLVDAPSEQTVSQHPEIAARLANGWTIRRADPRVVETDGAKWLVVLERSPRTEAVPLSSGEALTARSRREERVRKCLETISDPDSPKRSPSGQKR